MVIGVWHHTQWCLSGLSTDFICRLCFHHHVISMTNARFDTDLKHWPRFSLFRRHNFHNGRMWWFWWPMHINIHKMHFWATTAGMTCHMWSLSSISNVSWLPWIVNWVSSIKTLHFLQISWCIFKDISIECFSKVLTVTGGIFQTFQDFSLGLSTIVNLVVVWVIIDVGLPWPTSVRHYHMLIISIQIHLGADCWPL